MSPPIIIGFLPMISAKRRNDRDDIKNPRKKKVPSQEVVPLSDAHNKLKSVIQFRRTTCSVYGFIYTKPSLDLR